MNHGECPCGTSAPCILHGFFPRRGPLRRERQFIL
jgi:hypothetical protein